MDAREVTDHLLRRSHWTASRSSGPGGQRRDKVETRAELTIDLESLEGLDEALASRLAQQLGLAERPLRITCQDERSLTQNQEILVERLSTLVGAALTPPRPRRQARRPTRSERAARLADKSQRSKVKRLRQPPGGEE